MRLRERLAEEPLSRLSVAFGRKQEVDGLAAAIDGSIQVDPTALDLHVCLIHALGAVAHAQMRPDPLLHLGCIGLDPYVDGPSSQGVFQCFDQITCVYVPSARSVVHLLNFAASAGAQIDLMRGVGGYSSVADVLGALDHNGKRDTVLALGSNGYIQFDHTSVAAFTADNFRFS